MDGSGTARQLARAATAARITDVARRQLAEVGASGLSLRAVAREMGLASSALYRYCPHRDALLTALVIDAYDALGAAGERSYAAAARAGTDPGGQWLQVCRACRHWRTRTSLRWAMGRRCPATPLRPTPWVQPPGCRGCWLGSCAPPLPPTSSCRRVNQCPKCH